MRRADQGQASHGPSQPRSARSAAVGVPQPPRLIGLYRDVYDDDGNPVGWTVIGWGLMFPDKSAVTVPAYGQSSATVWQNVDDALRSIDAEVCNVNPRPFAQWWREQQP